MKVALGWGGIGYGKSDVDGKTPLCVAAYKGTREL